MLKVCSILMIIGAGIGVIISVLAFLGAGLVSATVAAGGEEALAEIGGAGAVTSMYIWLVVGAIGTVIQLVAGIVGVQAAKMPSVSKIKASLIFGLLVVVLSLASSIGSIVTSGFSGNAVFSLLIGLVIPALYLFGLIQYKNALVALLSGE